MLTHHLITTILPVRDVERSREFYAMRLGLDPTTQTPEGLIFEDGRIELQRRDDPRPVEHTALSFEVEDVADEVRELESRGVAFEDYDLPGLRTENHVAQLGGGKAAWLRDPDGNILCIHQRPR